MAGRLEDKVVVIVGGSTGTGRAAAELFAGEGAKLVLLARRKERLTEAVRQLGPRTVGLPTDISDPTSVRDAFAEVEERFGKLDVLLNMAAVARVRLIEEATDEDIATVVGTNFVGPIYTTRSAIPLLRRAGGGDIVNVGSEVALDDQPLMTLYSATKHGLHGFTRTMTKELKSAGIRVSLLVQGATTPTAFGDNFGPGDFERALPAWEADGYLDRVAGREPMDARWVAETILFIVTRPRGQMLDVVHARATR